MTRESKLTTIINKARQEGRLARIPFLTAGCPGPDSFWAAAAELAASGADILEIGVPFSDPVADGPVVAAASQEALAQGIDLDYIFNGLQQKSDTFKNTGLVLMGYSNPFLQYGWNSAQACSAGTVEGRIRASLEHLAQQAAGAGVDGFIIPDLPLAEATIWHQVFEAQGLDLIALVGPNTSLERMKEYAASATGYVYVVSILGTTGVREGLPPEVKDVLKRAHQAFNLPLALGFGLKEPGQLKGLTGEEAPEAVVFGSALIQHLKAGKKAFEFMAPWC